MALSLAQVPAIALRGLARNDAVQVTLQSSIILASRACGEVVVAAREYDGAQQHCLHALCEYCVVCLDLVPALTQLMGKTNRQCPQQRLPGLKEA